MFRTQKLYLQRLYIPYIFHIISDYTKNQFLKRSLGLTFSRKLISCCCFCLTPDCSVLIKSNDSLRTLGVGFFGRHHVNCICSFPAQIGLPLCASIGNRFQIIRISLHSFPVLLTNVRYKLQMWTYHCIKYINSPLFFAEPRILSASKPLLNPYALLSSSSIAFFLLLIKIVTQSFLL